MNRNLFLVSKYVLSNGNIFYRIKVYLIPQLPRRKSLQKYTLFSLWNRTGKWEVFLFWLRSKKRITLIGDNTLTETKAIGYYFYCGYDYKSNVHLLKTHLYNVIFFQMCMLFKFLKIYYILLQKWFEYVQICFHKPFFLR